MEPLWGDRTWELNTFFCNILRLIGGVPNDDGTEVSNRESVATIVVTETGAAIATDSAACEAAAFAMRTKAGIAAAEAALRGS